MRVPMDTYISQTMNPKLHLQGQKPTIHIDGKDPGCHV